MIGKEMVRTALREKWNHSSKKEIEEKGEAVASIFSNKKAYPLSHPELLSNPHVVAKN